jgi:hypothetical protein
MRKFVTTLVVALLIPVSIMQSASGYQSRARADSPSWQQLSPSPQVWILGNQVRTFECLARPTQSTFSLQFNNSWVEVARARAAIDPKLCTSSAAPYAAKYQFTLNFEGQQDFPIPGGTNAKLLRFQIAYNNISPSSGIAAVYSSASELGADEIDGKLPGATVNDEGDQAAQISITPKAAKSPVSLRPSVTAQTFATVAAQATAGWNGCSFNGVPLFGRVKYVAFGAQFKIRLASANAALKVKAVTHPAKTCGEWQFVQANPTFTVQIVKSGEDFTVSLGAARPGLKN